MGQPLFTPIADRNVMTYDLHDRKVKRNLKNFKFRVSVYGILRKGNAILCQRHPELTTYGLPGGGVEIGESIEKALVREFEEETGLVVTRENLVSVTEDFFTCGGQDAHTILVTYTVNEAGGILLADGNNDDTREVKYIDLDDLTSKNTQRVFWKIVSDYQARRDQFV